MSEKKDDLTVSIDYVAINMESGTTVSGTSQLSQAIYQQPQPERDTSASQLLIQNHEIIKQVEPIIWAAVHNVLENPNSSAQGKKGNVTIFLNSNFYGSSVSGDVYEANITLINEWNVVKNEADLTQLRTELTDVIQKMQEQAKEGDHRTDLANITLARDELNKADGPAMLKYLKKIGGFGKDIIIEIGAETIKKIILGQ